MKVVVVIPCYKVEAHILDVLKNIGDEVDHIIVVDDCCPDGSGKLVRERANDQRIHVIIHEQNKGVGGAVMTGYQAAIEMKADVCVKVDGDGQMDPKLIPLLIKPITLGKADYVKGNRFFSLYDVSSMPKVRLLGNAFLSFITKLSSGYWSIFDPTNGFTAIHKTALDKLTFKNINERYFFETDMLIELGGARATVMDMPMSAVYGEEVSGLKISDIAGMFLMKHIKAIAKRLLYNYYFRDFSLGSLHLPVGVVFILFGIIFGVCTWIESIATGVPATTGTVILSALPTILGVQFILSFFSFDIANEPQNPLQAFEIRLDD